MEVPAQNIAMAGVEFLNSRPQAEREFVEQTLVAIITQADFLATKVAGLLKERGFRASRPNPKFSLAPASSGTPAEVMLLTLAAALQLRSWDLADQTKHLSEGLPTAAYAFNRVTNCAEAKVANPPQLMTDVFKIWFEKFVHSARMELGSDVLVLGTDEEMIDRLADFFWDVVGSPMD